MSRGIRAISCGGRGGLVRLSASTLPEDEDHKEKHDSNGPQRGLPPATGRRGKSNKEECEKCNRECADQDELRQGPRGRIGADITEVVNGHGIDQTECCRSCNASEVQPTGDE